MSKLRARVSQDSVSVALGGEDVLAALRDAGIDVVPVGSRGMFWLEPLVEFETAAGWQAYGPVDAADVPSMVAAASTGP